MKLAPARLDRFLAAPDATVRAILVYGGDTGQVRERADSIAAALVPDPRDPFRVSELTGDTLAADRARLNDEAQAQSLMAGRRLVRVRAAGEAVGELFEEFFAAPPPGDAMILVEAGELAARSSLRRAFEAAKAALAIACYFDEAKDLRGLVATELKRHRITVSEDALEYLANNLGGDRLLTRQELEKLTLYAGEGGTLDRDEAAALVGDSAVISAEDAIFAAGTGDAAALERALGRAFAEGETAVGVLRVAQRHFQRLHLAGARVAAGAGAEDAIGRLRPPVFFKLKPSFVRQLGLWPPRRAAQAMQALAEAERNCKRTGPPPEAVCRDALLRLARAAAAPRRR